MPAPPFRRSRDARQATGTCLVGSGLLPIPWSCSGSSSGCSGERCYRYPARRRPRCEHGGSAREAVRRSRRVFVAGQVVAATRRDDACRTRFCIRAGVHRLPAPVVPRSRQVFIGEPGAILSGARTSPLASRSGRHWVASASRHRNRHATGQCRGGGSACTYRTTSTSTAGLSAESCRSPDLRPGTFFFDHDAGQVWIARDPRGHHVDVGRTPRRSRAGSGAVGVVVEGLVVEKFANQSGVGAVQGREGWIVTANEVRLNHGVGVQGADVVTRNRIHHNGQLGYSTYGATGTLFAENEVANNNYADYDWFWEAGGAKFMVTTRLYGSRQLRASQSKHRARDGLGQRRHPLRGEPRRGQPRPRDRP